MKKLGQYFLVSKEKVGIILDALQLRRGDFLIEIGPGRGALTNQLRVASCKLRDATQITRMRANKNEEGIRTKDKEGEGEESRSFSTAFGTGVEGLKGEEELLKRNKESGNGIEIMAIEKDEALAEALEKEMGGEVEIIRGDALRELPRVAMELDRAGRSYKIVGNIPYHITGQLFRILGELLWKPELTVLMIQKEVAERVCAKPPKMNILSACVQLWAEPGIVGFVPRGDFSPKPKVDGGIIKLRVVSCKLEKEEKEEDYYRLVRALFKQPRKTILNNFQSSSFNFQKSRGGDEESRKIEKLKRGKEEARRILESAGIKPGDRPQNLNVEDILRLRDKIFS